MINGKFAVCLGACILLKSVSFAQSTTSNPYNITVPVRAGVLPNISTQGKNDMFTTSNFSLNIFGGYTGSVNGLELGGWFNIDKRNLQGVQAAGFFNVTNGDVKGLQLGGLFNGAKNNVTGAQVGGLFNYTDKNANGMQTAGIYNHVSGTFNGFQTAGICNYTQQSVKGMQLAGITNINTSVTKGVQIAGIFNYTKHLKGFQLGLINMADTSDGYSIGLLNIVKKGYHKITLSTNEVLNVNLAIKSGNAKLYNILMVGINAGDNDKIFSYGYGLGHEMKVNNWLTVNPELSTQYLYLGNWNYLNLLSKCQVLATVKLTRGLALFGGPAFSVYYSDQPEAEKGYKFQIPGSSYHTYDLGHNNVTGWIGWTAGVSFL
ncbi:MULTISPECIES: hypothetical protein [Niastella]|uniref:DUF5723 domain-containing protein n=1 Tax=Niastella soli TaxID=2821487 RepID=A0ABS3YTP3_9BACT|nr:hypothetical protein [Niastella soli]MBO9201263.1 hypothetical protein [Niastella soli]